MCGGLSIVHVGIAQSDTPAAFQWWQTDLVGHQQAGDTYLRTLMIHGARAVIRFAENKAEPESWLRKLMARRNKNVAAVALANKNARVVWALLANDRTFRPDYTPAIDGRPQGVKQHVGAASCLGVLYDTMHIKNTVKRTMRMD